MGLRFRTHILVLVVFIFFMNGLRSQCSFPSNMPIVDDSIAVYSINISGALNDNLNANGICGISIKFRHNIIGDVEIKLVSPFGQEVILIGPTAPLSNLTTFTIWDIFFTPCGNAASPDFPFSPIFNNLQLWGQLAQYNGTYYPNQGCLEDFDTGPVNGIWQLIVSDVNQFDEGLIESFEIYFCDDSGVDCESCDAIAGIITNDNISACQGDSVFATKISVLFPGGMSDSMQYTNEFVVFNDTSIYEYSLNPNPRLYPPGIYTICNVDVKSDQLTLLPSVGALVGPEEYIFELNQSGACAEIGDSCFLIQILEPVSSIDSFRQICLGDTIQFFDLSLSDEGSYPVSIGQGSCDTVYTLHLDVVDTNPVIVSDQSGLGCSDDSLLLTVNHEELDKNVSYSWSTNNGNIVSNVTGSSILVDSVGWYFVETSVGNCTQSDSFLVEYSDILPVITLTSDTVDCILADATVTIISSKTLVDRDWTGPGILAEGLLTLKVGLPGVYTLVGTDIDGCTAEVSIDVPGNTDPPDISFDIEPISCFSDSASVTIHGVQESDTINWLNYNDIESDTFAYFTALGEFYIQSTGVNGCDRLDTIIIEDVSYEIVIEVEDDTINCFEMMPVPGVSISNSMGQNTFLWTFPGGGISALPSPVLNEAGTYSVLVEDINKCKGETTFNVEQDLLPPLILVTDTIFTCIDDSIQIGILNPNPDFSYLWSGPLAYESTDEEPFIYYAGDYIVEVTDLNGCSSSARITVIEGADLPTSSFQIVDIDCFTDTATITPLDTAGLLFEYESPFLLSSVNEPYALISNGGPVFLTITERSSGCSNSYEFQVNDLRSYVDLNLSVDTLNCQRDTVLPQVFISDPVSDLTWTGPQNFSDTIPSITIPGVYVLEVKGLNGCSSIDSIEVIYDGGLPDIAIETDTIFCDPDSAYQIVSAVNAATFLWYKDQELIGNRDTLVTYEGGIYKAIVQTANGCVDSIEVQVIQDTIPPEILLDISAPISCDDSISTISSGVFNPANDYNWSGPGILNILDNSIEVDKEGQYFLSLTDPKGCSAFDSILVEDDRVEPGFEVELQHINCYASGRIDLTALNNIDQIIWDGPETIPNDAESANISEPGIYSITGFSAMGCEFRDTVEIEIDTLIPEIIDVISDTITCKNQLVELGFVTLNPIDSILLTGPETKIADSLALVGTPGIYQVTLIGNNGCRIDTMMEVQIDTISPESHILGDTLTCLRSKVLLTLDDYDNVSNVYWTGPGVDEDGLDLFINQIGSYTARIEGFNGCVYIDSITITEDKHIPTIDLQDTFYLPCNGDSIELFIETNDNIVFYRWIGSGFFSDLSNPSVAEPLEITLFASGTNGCNTIDSTVVLEDDRIIDFDVLFDSITCINPITDLIPVRVDDDESYYWVYPDGSIIQNQVSTSNMGGIHKLVVHGGNQCYDSLAFTINVDTIHPQAAIVYEDTIECDHRIVELVGEITVSRPDYIYTWSTVDGNFVEGQSTLNPMIDSEGTYTLTVLDTLNGCESSATIQVNEEAQSFSDFLFEAFDPFCKGESTGLIRILDFINPVGAVDIFINGELLDSLEIDGLSPGTYEIKAVDAFGCELERIVEIGEGLEYSIDIQGDTVIALGDSTLLEVQSSDPGISFDSISWFTSDFLICPDCDDIYVQLVENDFVIVQTVTVEGCKALDSILIRVTADVDYDFPTIFSPNGDGVNDVFKIPELKEFDQIERIMIFDRWGSVVHKEEQIPIQAQQGWDGKLDGRYALPGVYVVLLDVRLKNGRIVKKASDLTLIR